MKCLYKVLLTASLALTCLPAWAGHKEPGKKIRVTDG